MSDPPETFVFPAPVLRFPGKSGHPYVPLPEDVAAVLRQQRVRRVRGTLNGHAFDRAIQQWRTGPCLIFGQAALRKLGARVGDNVLIELVADADPDQVPLCPELAAALAQDPEAAARFDGLTPGRRRSLNYYVDSARRSATRERRAVVMAYKLRTSTLHDD